MDEPIISIWSRYHDAIMARLCELYWQCGFPTVPALPHTFVGWWPF